MGRGHGHKDGPTKGFGRLIRIWVSVDLGRDMVSPSSCDSHREMTELLKPQQVQQYHMAK